MTCPAKLNAGTGHTERKLMQCEPFQGTRVKQTSSYIHLDRQRHRCRYRYLITILLRKLIVFICFNSAAVLYYLWESGFHCVSWKCQFNHPSVTKKITLEKSQLKTSKETRCFILVLMILYIKSFATIAKYNLPYNVLNTMINIMTL